MYVPLPLPHPPPISDLRTHAVEQTIHHAHMHPDDSLPYPPLRAHASDIPPQFRTNEHHSGHATHRNYKDTPEYAEHGEAVRRMAPPPQRQAQDGTGRAYTKSPNYADNYGKTKRAAAVHAEA